MASIHPEYLTFGKLINNRLFRIPEYQRAYSWQSEQRDDLFEDIRRPARMVARNTTWRQWLLLARARKSIRIRFPKSWMGSNESRH